MLYIITAKTSIKILKEFINYIKLYFYMSLKEARKRLNDSIENIPLV